MGWFKTWFGTRYYALLYGHRDEQDAQNWVDAIIGRWQLPVGSSVLDIGCGRGRHAGLFARAGMQVTGLDLSEQSIEEARIAWPKVEFHVHDMRHPFADERFDAAVCLFTTLGYFDTLQDDLAVLRAAYGALRPGGRLVIDFMNTPKVLANLVNEEELEREGVRFHVLRAVEEGVVVKRIAVSDAGHTSHYEERVQALTPESLERMALEVGFIMEGRTDGPKSKPYITELSERYVLWLKRPIP
jgi:SAM-dependent methyltransferase